MIIAPSLKLLHMVRKNSNTYRLLKQISARLAKELIQGTDPVISPQSFFYTTLQGTCHDNCHFPSSLESWSGLEIEREAGRSLPHCGGLAGLVEALNTMWRLEEARAWEARSYLCQARLSCSRGASLSWQACRQIWELESLLGAFQGHPCC